MLASIPITSHRWCVTSSSISPLVWIMAPGTWNSLSWRCLRIQPHFHISYTHINELALHILLVLLILKPLDSKVCLHTFSLSLTQLCIPSINTMSSTNKTHQGTSQWYYLEIFIQFHFLVMRYREVESSLPHYAPLKRKRWWHNTEID